MKKTAPPRLVTLALLIPLLSLTACSGGSSNATSSNVATDVIPPHLPAPIEPSPEDSPVTLTDTDLNGYSGPDIGFFENRVLDDEPEILYAVENFTRTTNDTSRLKQALNRASEEDDGGVVRLKPAANGANTRFSLAHVAVPSNIRLEVDPDVVLEMRGIKELEFPTGSATNRPNRQFLFSFGRSNGPKNLLEQRVVNVEITSTDPTRNFTVDARTNMPISYGLMSGGNGGGQVNLTRAIPFGFFYVENFATSNVTIEDNHTESVSVQMFADADYQDGAYAYRFGSTPVFLNHRYVKNPSGSANLNIPMNEANIPLTTNANNEFIDESGNVISDIFAIRRNPTYGRTPVKGSIKNIRAINAHTGYGAVQVYGGDWIEIDNIDAFNGIGVRVEAGNGTDTDNFNRSGPYYSSMNKIKISNVTVTQGFTGVWLKPHSKIMKDISVENIEAIDSGTALLIGKGSFACHLKCRDLTRGRINNLEIKGDIVLRQTIFDRPVAEVGNLATYFLSQSNREHLAAQTQKSLTTISRNDLEHNVSGERWYLIFPTAPVLALSQLSATEIGNQSSKEGFYPVDLSQANIMQDGLALADDETERPDILYRSDMKTPNGQVATDFIFK
ncbi:hypothetical protein [Echinimonas agarilytica]|uniref:Uncharacterized protein n=1 Tax=Echinimonas agarilytica TaxID=1215918 RepID=A0AA42B8Y7_9GAMM|nr:hypothetical protein [Echinimonas agarilytica]MCM2681068.1 hypothetical protein [Echinimonas agarilytica]